MKLKKMLAAVALTMLGALAVNAAAKAQDDPGPAAYDKALKGKRVVLVPMAMGFDLAAGLGRLSEARSRGLGRHVRDPRPELGYRGRRPGHHRPDLFRSEAGCAGGALARPQLLLEAPEEGAGGRDLRGADRQSHELSRPTPSSAATGIGWASSRPKRWSRAAARTHRRRSAWCRATPPTPPRSISTTAS